MSGTYEDLKAWQRAIDLVTAIYQSTRTFPNDELYGLTNQLRRAAVSVASNIAEGKGRNSERELLQFLSFARGSINEVKTQLLIAEKLSYLSPEQYSRLRDLALEVGRLLGGLIKSFHPNP